MTTNEFERDVNDTSFLKRPGRVDLRILQNTADCGDGHPGLQRCFRNYLHEGGMEKDLDLIGYSIKGTSVDLTNSKLQEFNHIGATTISAAQWVYVGGADQAVKQTDSPTFGGLSLTGNLVLAANSITGTSVDINNVKMQQLSNIGAATISGAQWGYLGAMDQALHQSQSPQFAGLSLTGNLTLAANSITGTDVDINNAEMKQLSNIGSNTINVTQWGYLNNLNQALHQSQSPTFVGLTLSADLVTTSTVDGVDISDFKTEFEAFNAIGSANAQYIASTYEHSQDFGQDFNLQQLKFANKGGTGAELMHFSIPLPCNKGSYSLKLDDIILYLTDADGTNKIERLSVDGLQNNSTEDVLFIDETDKTSPQTVTYDLSNLDCDGYWKLVIIVATTSGTTDTIEFAAPIVKYFYS